MIVAALLKLVAPVKLIVPEVCRTPPTVTAKVPVYDCKVPKVIADILPPINQPEIAVSG